jgi:catechol 2,3-dioxygenase-like lactoylglutathione lyase family enzyme
MEAFMEIRLHEIEFFSEDVESAKGFYQDVLGLGVAVDQEGLKVFDSGLEGVDLNVSVHNKDKVSMSFLVEDIDEYAEGLKGKGVNFDGPVDIHLGMRAIRMEDPDGRIIEIQCAGEDSPPWLKDIIK